MSGKKRKRSRPDPASYAHKIEQVHSRAKEKALELLIRTLQSRPDGYKQNLIETLRGALGVTENTAVDGLAPSEDATQDHSEHEERKEVNRIGSDEHNEVCEVCEKGGKLLCCDTCSLVFHLECVRPKLDRLPRGKWSCAYCIADSIAKGDKEAAKKAVLAMKSISSRHSNRRGKRVQTPQARVEEAVPMEASPTKSAPVAIFRSGRKYVVKEKLTTLGRYDTLEDAIQCYRTHTQPFKSDNANDEDDELWCSYCLDDNAIEVCAFCGCKACFGKHDTDSLLLCDGCDSEYHIYCLDPPLQSVPTGRWYCLHCLQNRSDDDSEQLTNLEEPSVDCLDKHELSTSDHNDGALRHEDGGIRENSSRMLGSAELDCPNGHGVAHGRHNESELSENSLANHGSDIKRPKLSSESPAVSTSYDLAAVVQLSSNMSSRLLDADELNQLASVRASAIPDHLHTLLDALHQQKHLILKKLDKEESLARKRAATKDSPSDDSVGSTPGSGQKSGANRSPSRDNAANDGESDSPRVSQPNRKRHAREHHGKAEVRRTHRFVADDVVEPSTSDTSHHYPKATSTAKSDASAKSPTSKGNSKPSDAGDTGAGKTISAVAVVSQAISNYPSRTSSGNADATGQPAERSLASNGSVAESSSQIAPSKDMTSSGQIGRKYELDTPNSNFGPTSSTTPTSVTAMTSSGAPAMLPEGPTSMLNAPIDYLLAQHHVLAKPDAMLPVPGMPSMGLSQLASSLTADQMLQLMGNEMFLAQSHLGGIGGLGFTNGILDYARQVSGLPPLPLSDLPGPGLTPMLHHRQFQDKPVRPTQNDLLIATLAATFSHTSAADMCAMLGQPGFRWLAQESQSSRGQDTSNDVRSADPAKMRKYSMKHK